MGLAPGNATVKFSPYKILTHPALILPQETSDEEVTAEVAKTNRDIDNLTGEAVAPEMSSPGYTAREGVGVRKGPANMGLCNARVSLAEPKPDGGICRCNGQVSGRKAAVVIMAHMDRLAAKIAFGKERVPIVGHAGAGETDDEASMRGNGNRRGDKSDSHKSTTYDHDIYIVDVSPDTFELLASILASTSEDEQFHDLGEEENIQTYMILATLRILKANLVRLLQSDISNIIVESMLDKPRPFDPDDTGELQYDDELRHKPVMYSLFVDLPTKGRSNSIGGDHNTAEVDSHARTKNASRMTPVRPHRESGDVDLSAEVERYRVVLYSLQRRLLLLVHSESACGDDLDGIEPVQKQAADVLVLGLELFFPGQTEQFRLLSKLINTATIDDEDQRDILVGGGSESFDHPIGGPRAARHYILNPLLQRLCNNALTSKLIPYGVDVDNVGSVCTTVEVSEPGLQECSGTAASARLLEMQVRVLVSLERYVNCATWTIDDQQQFLHVLGEAVIEMPQ